MNLSTIFKFVFSIFGVNKEPAIIEINPDTAFVVEVPESAHHGSNFGDFVIDFEVVSCCFVEILCKSKIPSLLIVKLLPNSELRLYFDGEAAILFDDLFDIGSEFVVGVELLFDKSVLLEVFIKNIPEVMLLYFTIHHYIYILFEMKCANNLL